MAPSYELRIRLRQHHNIQQPAQDRQASPTNRNSSKMKSRRFRSNIKKHPELYAAYLSEAKIRSHSYRESLSAEQRLLYNEKAKNRMRKMREKKKLAAQQENNSTTETQTVKPVTRSDEEKVQKQREKWKTEKRLYRSRMTAQKCRRINEKRRAKYRESVAAIRRASAPSTLLRELPVTDNMTNQSDCRSDDAKRKALQRARQSLPKNPAAFANTAGKLIDSCSPRKKGALAKVGVNKPSHAHQKLVEALQKRQNYDLLEVVKISISTTNCWRHLEQ